jgi:hypothetical protein
LASKAGKVRNKNISVTIAAFCGLLAIYFSWAIWIGIFAETDSTSHAPGFIFESMAEIAEYGAWELFGTVPQGVVLYLFWAIEALLVIGVAGYIAQSTTEAVPYCEGCNKWAEETEVSNLLEWNTDMPGLTKKLETGNFDALLMIPLVGTPKQFTAVKAYRCPTCQQKHHLTVARTSISIDSDNAEVENVDMIVENLIIDATTYQRIVAWEQPAAAPLSEFSE